MKVELEIKNNQYEKIIVIAFFFCHIAQPLEKKKNTGNSFMHTFIVIGYFL